MEASLENIVGRFRRGEIVKQHEFEQLIINYDLDHVVYWFKERYSATGNIETAKKLMGLLLENKRFREACELFFTIKGSDPEWIILGKNAQEMYINSPQYWRDRKIIRDPIPQKALLEKKQHRNNKPQILKNSNMENSGYIAADYDAIRKNAIEQALMNSDWDLYEKLTH
jgi:hypothetical protein